MLNVIMLSVYMQNVFKLNVIILNVVMLSVVAPYFAALYKEKDYAEKNVIWVTLKTRDRTRDTEIEKSMKWRDTKISRNGKRDRGR
jgi:hypothetical protein